MNDKEQLISEAMQNQHKQWVNDHEIYHQGDSTQPAEQGIKLQSKVKPPVAMTSHTGCFPYPVIVSHEFEVGFNEAVLDCEIEANRQHKEKVQALQDENKRLREDVKQLRNALVADATDLWGITNAIKKEIQSREWIQEGRGCYAWDDQRYKDETRIAFEAIEKLIMDVQHPAQLRFHAANDKALADLKLQQQVEEVGK